MIKSILIILTLILSTNIVFAEEWKSMISSSAAIIIINPAIQLSSLPIPTQNNTSKFMIIEFGAVWCGPCKTLEKTWKNDEITKYLAENKNIQQSSVDGDKEKNLVDAWKVTSFPTTIITKWDDNRNGWIEQDRIVGSVSKDNLLKFLKTNINKE